MGISTPPQVWVGVNFRNARAPRRKCVSCLHDTLFSFKKVGDDLE